MIKPQFFKGLVEFNKIIAQDTHHLRIRPQLPDVFDFNPGQFVTITVAPMAKRSYSIASTPKQNYIDLLADTKRGGLGSQFFVNAVAGQEVEVIGPLGIFTMRENDHPVMFWATGTGIVPFLSMIKDLLTTKASTKKIVLNCSFRFAEDIFGKEELEQLAKDHPNFTLNLYISRPNEAWTGKSGRITEYFNTEKIDLAFDHYLCGAKEMISDVTAKITEQGTPKEQIYHEQYY